MFQTTPKRSLTHPQRIDSPPPLRRPSHKPSTSACVSQLTKSQRKRGRSSMPASSALHRQKLMLDSRSLLYPKTCAAEVKGLGSTGSP
jgi:hypothetical protein